MTIKVSVVVPTFQRNDLLARCLDSLAPGIQTADPSQYEVIVTDDGQSITAETMISERYPWARWTKAPGLSAATNRNNGAKHAIGEFVAFTDDDCIADKNWVQAIINASPGVDVVEGQTVVPDHVDSPFQQGVENISGGVYWSCNLAVRRALFERLGGFDQDFKQAAAEDMEFGWRASRAGIARYVPEVIIYHPVRIISLKTIYQRTFLARWHLLYRHKIGQAVPIDESPVKALADIAASRFMHQSRCTWQLFSKHNPRYWKTNLFYQAWNWITLPMMIVYLSIWEMRYRKLLSRNGTAAGTADQPDLRTG